MLEKVIENWTSRLDYIRASRGSPTPEIIFKITVTLSLHHSSCYSTFSGWRYATRLFPMHCSNISTNGAVTRIATDSTSTLPEIVQCHNRRAWSHLEVSCNILDESPSCLSDDDTRSRMWREATWSAK
ncbi:hypothetical protein TNCV_3066401 [Trichonephila clavipes]|uniref:Uncharacterized protein n=1 Tax=Trichonephila clavipes TaxID=2585209 RepID=A0A8X6V3D1_TRICX|nr:hypothetical protein TNCV_3066401 [Trichonephila clavipes]